jgi:ABC-2 type transport system permease protein
MATSPSTEMRLVAPRRSVRAHIGEVWEYRELLGQLIRKELKVKYRDSTLGFAWSLLNPAFLMGIYYVVFQIFLKVGIPRFPIWLLSALLVWSFFSSSLAAGTNSITSNSYLIGKVRFPREVLPLASVGAAFVHLCLQYSVLLVVIAAFRTGVAWTYLPIVPLALLSIVLLACALAIMLGSINVYARDTQHLLELTLLAWFWLTPIIYQFSIVTDELKRRGLPVNLALLNPVTSITLTFQRVFYGKAVVFPKAASGTGTSRLELLPLGGPGWYLRNVLIILAISAFLVLLSLWIFDRAEGNFAEAI